MSDMPQKYRWLTVGQRYTYRAKEGKGTDARRGETCVVMTVPRPKSIGNVLVEFEDNQRMVVPAGVLKKVVEGVK